MIELYTAIYQTLHSLAVSDGYQLVLYWIWKDLPRPEYVEWEATLLMGVSVLACFLGAVDRLLACARCVEGWYRA